MTIQKIGTNQREREQWKKLDTLAWTREETRQCHIMVWHQGLTDCPDESSLSGVQGTETRLKWIKDRI